jgi:hypothetical protein
MLSALRPVEHGHVVTVAKDRNVTEVVREPLDEPLRLSIVFEGEEVRLHLDGQNEIADLRYGLRFGCRPVEVRDSRFLHAKECDGTDHDAVSHDLIRTLRLEVFAHLSGDTSRPHSHNRSRVRHDELLTNFFDAEVERTDLRVQCGEEDLEPHHDVGIEIKPWCIGCDGSRDDGRAAKGVSLA